MTNSEELNSTQKRIMDILGYVMPNASGPIYPTDIPVEVNAIEDLIREAVLNELKGFKARVHFEFVPIIDKEIKALTRKESEE